MVLICKTLSPLYLWMLCAKWLRRKFLKLGKGIFSILLLSPLGKVHSPSFEHLWISNTQEFFVPSVLKFVLLVCRRRCFWFQYCNFYYFVIICTWKMASTWRNLNPLHPRMLCVKLVEIGPVVLEKKVFKYVSKF